MESIKLAVLGAGSVRCSVPVIASLATYFGERPMDIALYDADAERLDLFDAFARTAFVANKNMHQLESTINAEEALERANKVILQIDENCAGKEARAAGMKVAESPVERVSETLERLLQDIRNETQVMSLQTKEVRVPLDYYYRLDWPLELNVSETRAIPHQVLRWIRGEEYLFDLFKEVTRSPLKLWLDDVSTAIVVSDA